MDDAFGMRGVERVGDLDTKTQRLLKRKRLVANGVLESMAFEAFHDDEWVAIHFADFMDSADVGMIQRGGGLGFALETLKRLLFSYDVVRKELQGNETAQPGIFGFVNDAHASAAEFFDNVKMCDGAADEGRGIRHVSPILESRGVSSQRIRARMNPGRILEDVEVAESGNEIYLAEQTGRWDLSTTVVSAPTTKADSTQ
jgi:hypothetical protein